MDWKGFTNKYSLHIHYQIPTTFKLLICVDRSLFTVVVSYLWYSNKRTTLIFLTLLMRQKAGLFYNKKKWYEFELFFQLKQYKS